MAATAESSSSTPNPASDKPVIVRVKRKVAQSPLDAFWLEINERPLKRPVLDFEKLAISNSEKQEEQKAKKVLVQHVETVAGSEAPVDFVQSFFSASADATDCKTKSEERRHTFKKDNRQEQLLSKARQQQQAAAKSARFKQIWRSRKANNDGIHAFCHFYDVLRIDGDEKSNNVPPPQECTAFEDKKILASYLPLLREFIPNAAQEIESDIQDYLSKQTEEYVYDYYTVKTDMKVDNEDALHPFPLVKVEDEEFYDGPSDSEYDSQDSNAEDNPRNDYPDEMSEEEEKEAHDEDNEEMQSDGSDESKDWTSWRKNSGAKNAAYEDDIYDDFDSDGYGFGYRDAESNGSVEGFRQPYR